MAAGDEVPAKPPASGVPPPVSPRGAVPPVPPGLTAVSCVCPQHDTRAKGSEVPEGSRGARSLWEGGGQGGAASPRCVWGCVCVCPRTVPCPPGYSEAPARRVAGWHRGGAGTRSLGGGEGGAGGTAGDAAVPPGCPRGHPVALVAASVAMAAGCCSCLCQLPAGARARTGTRVHTHEHVCTRTHTHMYARRLPAPKPAALSQPTPTPPTAFGACLSFPQFYDQRGETRRVPSSVPWECPQGPTALSFVPWPQAGLAVSERHVAQGGIAWHRGTLPAPALRPHGIVTHGVEAPMSPSGTQQ